LLAKALGVHVGTIAAKRRARGFKLRPHEWTRKELALLGKISDVKASKRIGLAPSVVGAKRAQLGIPPAFGTPRPRHKWTRAEVALLGKSSDVALAKRLGVGASAVREKRVKLGITAIHRYRRHQWTRAEGALLGKLTDAEVARRIGVSEKTVSEKRKKLGFAP